MIRECVTLDAPHACLSLASGHAIRPSGAGSVVGWVAFRAPRTRTLPDSVSSKGTRELDSLSILLNGCRQHFRRQSLYISFDIPCPRKNQYPLIINTFRTSGIAENFRLSIHRWTRSRVRFADNLAEKKRAQSRHLSQPARGRALTSLLT